MGLNCWICLASFCLGSNVIIPKLRLNKGRYGIHERGVTGPL
jgi:hypothetical protein